MVTLLILGIFLISGIANQRSKNGYFSFYVYLFLFAPTVGMISATDAVMVIDTIERYWGDDVGQQYLEFSTILYGIYSFLPVIALPFCFRAVEYCVARLQQILQWPHRAMWLFFLLLVLGIEGVLLRGYSALKLDMMLFLFGIQASVFIPVWIISVLIICFLKWRRTLASFVGMLLLNAVYAVIKVCLSNSAWGMLYFASGFVVLCSLWVLLPKAVQQGSEGIA